MLAAGAVVVAGVVLRFSARSDLWLDEALSVEIARLPLGQLLVALRHDGSPPLYYLLLHAWIALVGTGDTAVRALSGVFATAALPLAWLSARRLADRRTAWAVLVLLAASPFAIQYGSETRMYSLLMVEVLAGLLALLAAWERPTPRRLALLALASAALALTHYWSLFLLVVVEAGLLLWARRPADRRHALRLAAGVAGGVVLFLPWLPTFLFQVRHTGTPWAVPAKASNLLGAISTWAGPGQIGSLLLVVVLGLVALGVLGRGVDGHRVELDLRGHPLGRRLGGACLATLLLALVVALLTHSGFANRYTSVAFPLFVLLIGVGVSTLHSDRVRHGVLAVTAVAGLVGGGLEGLHNRTEAGDVAYALRGLAHPGDVVGYCPDQLAPAVSRLAPPSLPQVSYADPLGPHRVDWVDYAAHINAADPVGFALRLNDLAGRHDVWLVSADGYRPFGRACADIADALVALRPEGRETVPLRDYFEHARLVRYRPSP